MHVCMGVSAQLQLGRLVSFHTSIPEWYASRVNSARCSIPFKGCHREPGFQSRASTFSLSGHGQPTVPEHLHALCRKLPDLQGARNASMQAQMLSLYSPEIQVLHAAHILFCKGNVAPVPSTHLLKLIYCPAAHSEHSWQSLLASLVAWQLHIACM